MSQSSRETDGKLAFPKGKARDHFCIIRHCCRGITYTFPLPHWFCPMCNLIHSLDLDLFLGWLLMSSPAIPQRLQREASGSYHCWKFVLCHWTAEVWLDDLQSWSFNIGCRLFWCGFTMDMLFFFVPSSWDYSIMRRGWKAYVWSSSKLVLFWKTT